MGLKETKERVEAKNISLDDLVPKDHLIRKIDKAINLDFIYDKVKNLYST
ncbi:MAG: IS5/IS1182 family transposase, partial [Cetobacterium sp.]